MSAIHPVLIVGAGPTGMTAAMELSRFGVPIRIVDKLREPSLTSRALAVQARTLELFEQRGLSEEMVRIGNQGRAASLYAGGKRLGKVDLAEIKSRYNYILLLSQAETERILREQLARQGIFSERGTEMVAFAQLHPTGEPGSNYSVRAVLRNDKGDLEELEAAYILCAEGAHSMVRSTLNLAFDGNTLGESYALADLHLDGNLPDDELSIFLGEHGFLAVFPMGNRHFRFIATDPENHAKGDSDPTLGELQRIYDQDSDLPVRLRDMTWSSRFRINSRMLQSLRERNIFFAGDAAHIHSPAGGQGMNTGIQDMINLGWKLAMVLQGKAAPELLNTYQEDRLPVIRSVVTKTEAATDAFNSEEPLVHKLISHVIPLVLGSHLVQGLSTGLISETASNYRASALSRTLYAGGRLRGGDRLPDLNVLAWNEEDATEPGPCETRLYQLLDPSYLTLLLVSSQRTPGLTATGKDQLRSWGQILKVHHITMSMTQPDATAAFQDALGSGQSLLIVRPDAYLGFVAALDEWPALIAWLTQWFPPAQHS